MGNPQTPVLVLDGYDDDDDCKFEDVQDLNPTIILDEKQSEEDNFLRREQKENEVVAIVF